MSAVLGLDDLFTIANRSARQAGGEQLKVTQLSEPAMASPTPGSFDVVILPPSLEQVRGEDEKNTHAWLRGQHAAGALVSSVCVGAF